MGTPKAFLSVAYFVASSRALWAMPTAPAATGGRVLSKAPMATLKPAPSPIKTFSAGTTTSSNVIPRQKKEYRFDKNYGKM